MLNIRYYIVSRTKLYLLLIAILFVIILALGFIIINPLSVQTTKLVMGAQLYSQHQESTEEPQPLTKQDTEKYFRPSKLPILNNGDIDDKLLFQDDGKKADKSKIPNTFFKSPEDTIINYFNIIREGENLTDEKSGGCGTVGNAKLPFPIAYAFLTPEYQQKHGYKEYLKSFEGIGHTNLIKLKGLPPDQIHPDDLRYFVEIETIEGSDKGVTYFAYYNGFFYIKKIGDNYLISDMQLYSEDFLCAPYHGWYHDAEMNVSTRYGNWCNMIEKQYPPRVNGYTKKIYFEGKDGGNYIIEFMQLTNGTDIEVAQYKQTAEGPWKVIYLNPEKCVEDKQ